MNGRYKIIIVCSFQTFTPGCGDENVENKNTSQTKISNEKTDNFDVVVVLDFGRRTDYRANF